MVAKHVLTQKENLFQEVVPTQCAGNRAARPQAVLGTGLPGPTQAVQRTGVPGPRLWSLNGNAFLRHICLNIRSQAAGAVWERLRGVALFRRWVAGDGL